MSQIRSKQIRLPEGSVVLGNSSNTAQETTGTNVGQVLVTTNSPGNPFTVANLQAEYVTALGQGNLTGTDVQSLINQLETQKTFTYRSLNTDPTSNDDENDLTLGNASSGIIFSVGDMWVNEASGAIFVCINNTSGSAQWVELGTNISSSTEVYDEGVLQGSFTQYNFIGTDVVAIPDNSNPNRINIYVPAPSFQSHWNTTDGEGIGTVAPTTSPTFTTARISTPTTEGTPFWTNSNGNVWAGTNQTVVHRNTPVSTEVYTSTNNTTGFGGNSTMTVTVQRADSGVSGAATLATFTTPAITANNTFNGGGAGNPITVNIASYGPDDFSLKFQAKATVTINFATIHTNNSLSGGRWRTVITHTTDTTTDGGVTYTYTSPWRFYDTNDNTAVATTPTIAETVGSIVTKHISGIEYYTTGSDFTLNVSDIDNWNENTQRINTDWELQATGTEYGLPTLSHTPVTGGTGAGLFTGWTNDYNQDNIVYNNTAWEINATDYRFAGPSGNISTQIRDPWTTNALQNSANASILVDTVTDVSTTLLELFDSENRRQTSGFNPGGAPNPAAGNWDSTLTLGTGVTGSQSFTGNDALVYGGRLLRGSDAFTMTPGFGALASLNNFTTYKPDLGGANPNYSTYTGNAIYRRTFWQTGTTEYSSYTFEILGSFGTHANALAALIASDLRIFLRKIDGSGNVGATSSPTWLHGTSSYNIGTFNDGTTQSNAGATARSGSSAGNIINGTTGSFFVRNGFYVEIQIIGANIYLDSVRLTLNA